MDTSRTPLSDNDLEPLIDPDREVTIDQVPTPFDAAAEAAAAPKRPHPETSPKATAAAAGAPAAPSGDAATGGSGRVPSEVTVAIIGAGFGGVDAAIQLKAAGTKDLVVLERAENAGGCWLANDYPGIACDVPSNLYSYSFAPNPNWSRTYSPGGEIAEYIQNVADKYGVMEDIRFGVSVNGARWIEDEQRWEVDTSEGPIKAQFLVSAIGPLTEPIFPDIKGRESFKGVHMHSARWDHSIDLTGKRVAAIGTGASAIQFVPALAKVVSQLDVYQRTAPWVLPRTDRDTFAIERALFRKVPALQRLSRQYIYYARELIVASMRGNKIVRKALERFGRMHLARQVRDPQLRKTLTPNFEVGCKRILLSNEWYPTVQKNNVNLITDGIKEITPEGVVTVDGKLHEVDAIVYGTGFHVTTPPVADVVRGRGGETLAEHWKGSPRAYKGTAIDGFPNLFFLVGPNTGVGHTSILLMIEWQVKYMVQAVAAAKANKVGAYDLRPEAMDSWVKDIDRLSKDTVWLSGGCSSYYVDATGRNSSTWPTYTWKLKERLAKFDASNYAAEPVKTPATKA